jgi:hypothetical protein
MKDRSELLTLLAQRFKDLGLGDGKPYRKPQRLDKSAVERAAKLHAQANRSDPYAYGRVMLHMRQGYELASDIIKEANGRLAAEHGSNCHE